MKIYIGTQHPPGHAPAFDNFVNASERSEAIAAIKDLYLALEEARSLDEYRIDDEPDKLTNLWHLMTHTPNDHLAMLRAWKSFRLPLMVDGSCAACEQAVEKMEAFLKGRILPGRAER